MAQLFKRSTNSLARVTIFAAIFLIAGLAWGLVALNSSSWNTRQGVILPQPVPFSHEHHVSGLGIDCRYCHSTVETSAIAGVPPTETCMNCHKQIWNDSAMLAPVRESYRTGKPIQWTRVHDLPDFVYFDHSIHVAKGVGCASCHGRIDKMPLTKQYSSMRMEWCIDCHRHPEQALRPKEEIFNMAYEAEDQAATGQRLLQENHILPAQQLTACSTCHR